MLRGFPKRIFGQNRNHERKKKLNYGDVAWISTG